MAKPKLTVSEKMKIGFEEAINKLNETYKSYMEKEQHGVEIIPGLASNGELIEVGGSKLPQAIIFDTVPLFNGDYINIFNIYTHFVNPAYIGGQCDPATPEEAMGIINTMEYVFMNRVKYFLMVLVQSSVCKMKQRFITIDESKLYESIMYKIERDFGDVIYSLKSYIGDRAIITKDTEIHMVLSMDTTFYNCLLNTMVGYPLNADDHDFISDLVREFDMIIGDYFEIYILREVECIYKPQLEAAIKKGIEFDELDSKAIPF